MESPKARFLKTSHAAQLVEIVEHPAFIAGCDAAMLQMQLDNFPDTMEASARSSIRFEGAKLFVQYLTTIGRAEKPKRPNTVKENLEP